RPRCPANSSSSRSACRRAWASASTTRSTTTSCAPLPPRSPRAPIPSACCPAAPSCARSTKLPGMQASIPYTVDTGENLVNETFGPNNIHRKTSGTQQLHPMEVRDGRQGKFSLDENGFTLVEHRTAVQDFLGENLEKVYYPEIAALIRKISGAKRVHVFDHTLRSGDQGEREAKL